MTLAMLWVLLGMCTVRTLEIKQKYPQTDTFYHTWEPQRSVEGPSSTPQEIAQMLAEGKSVALYDGAPEAGPRALGHRSILFDARNPNAKDEPEQD